MYVCTNKRSIKSNTMKLITARLYCAVRDQGNSMQIMIYYKAFSNGTLL